MRKLLFVCLFLLCTLFLFASGSYLNVKFSPGTVQIITSSNEAKNPIDSFYGLGAEVAYKRTLLRGLFVNAGVSWNLYKISDLYLDYHSIMAFAGAGYEIPLNTDLKLSLHTELALDTKLSNNKCSENIAVKTGLDFCYMYKSNFGLSIGCDGTFDFAAKNGSRFITYRIIPTVGLTVGL